jgi:16S rRNA (cytosine967-C5)-methyltransferase
VLDLCAAPGGKLTYTAQLMRNEGSLVAFDTSSERLKLVRENCGRMGVTCATEPDSAQTGSAALARPLRAQTAYFDRVLLDAPCSNTGVMRRRVDLRWRIGPEEIERLRGLQLDLLRQAAARVRPGGILVYSTCSLEPEENQSVVESFLSEHGEYELDCVRQLTPFAEAVDGAFVARLKRRAGPGPLPA